MALGVLLVPAVLFKEVPRKRLCSLDTVIPGTACLTATRGSM